MIKRRSTLDHSERIKKNREVQTLALLDLCLQIPVNERLIIRKKIKEGDSELSRRVYQCKKGRDFHSLQIYLRKYIQAVKNNERLAYTSFNNRDHPPAKHKLQYPKYVKTQGSRNHSLRSSFHTSPKEKSSFDKICKQINPLDLTRCIEHEIDREIELGVHNEDCTDECRGITPRDEEPSEIISESHSKNKQSTNSSNGLAMNIKEILMNKIKRPGHNCKRDPSKFSINNIFAKPDSSSRERFAKQNRFQIIPKQAKMSQTEKVKSNTQNYNPKFGEFYQRIKLTIEADI